MSLKIFSKWFNPPFLANARHFFMLPPPPHWVALLFFRPFREAKLLPRKFCKHENIAGIFSGMKIYALKTDAREHCCNLIAELSGATGGG